MNSIILEVSPIFNTYFEDKWLSDLYDQLYNLKNRLINTIDEEQSRSESGILNNYIFL